MDKDRIVAFLEASFLSPLLGREEITDIAFNGVDIFYEDKLRGRRKADIKVENLEVGNFLRQISNFAEKQFTYLNPILDVSFGKYRLNAMFFSVVRVGDKKAYSFSLRIGKKGSAVSDDPDFFPGKSKRIILEALAKHKSIVIAGETGSGKTELQKYLLSRLPSATRVINIDNVEELELSRDEESNLDLTSWHVDDKNPKTTFQALIRNALRNNPDYLLVAEVRGAETYDALQAAMSGHPIITTTHALDLLAIPTRLARLSQMGGQNLIYEDLLSDIYRHFDLLIFLRKEYDGAEIHRYVESIGEIDHKDKEVKVVFSLQKEEEEI